MTGRMKLMLAVLAMVAMLVALDRPPPVAVEVSEDVPRSPRKRLDDPGPAPPPLADNAPIPDLFAHGGEQPPASDQPAQAASQDEAQAQKTVPPARPFALIGFRQEGALREAYLLRTGDGNVSTVRVGDVLDGRYRVLAMRGEAVDIKDKASGASIRIGFEDHQ